jgi:hypothetical protein
MDRKDEQVERKLLELETAVDKEASEAHKLSVENPSSEVTKVTEAQVNSELCYFSGLALIGLGFLMLFQHVKVSTGMFSALGLGGGGFGLLMIPLLVGIALIMYDSKNKIGWGILVLTCVLILFAVLSALIMNFPTISLLGLIMMLVPFAAGAALILKGVGGPKALHEKLKEHGYLK